MVKKIFIVLLAVITTIRVSAQTVDEVTLVVSGNGPTKQDATFSALRNAIERTFGTFISANTVILNDNLIKDEIVSISSGGVKQYQELSTSILSDGQVSVSLQTTISVNKLINYAQNKGMECEFLGQELAMNIKLEKFNIENAETAISHLIEQLKPLIPNAFNFKFTQQPDSPSLLNDQTVRVHYRVMLDKSPNLANIFRMLDNTLSSISGQLSSIRSFDDRITNFFLVGPREGRYIVDPVSFAYRAEMDGGDISPYCTVRTDFYKVYRLPKVAARTLRIFLTREMTAACCNWRIRDNMNAVYYPIHNGAYEYWPNGHTTICCMNDKDDWGNDVHTLSSSFTDSSICKNAEASAYTIYCMPICSEYGRYSGISFPFYKFVGGSGFMIADDNSTIGHLLLYIPEEHIDKFNSFKLEHK